LSARVHSRIRRRQKPREGFLAHLLDPIDTLSEVIFSVLILLTFTLAFRIFMLDGQHVTQDYVNDLVWAALGATIAWGVIDGIMYALFEVLGRSERRRLLWHIQAAHTPDEAVAAIADEFDYMLEPITGEEQRRTLYQDILDHLQDSEPRAVGLKREDLTGGLASVLVAVLAVTPSFVPFFIFYNDYALAIRLSNVVSFVVLFAAGYEWGRYTGVKPWKTGLLVMGVGALLVGIAIPLGG
jgi:VIT1/CCC1 family predicted Fe2+/Mn2+ transporter